MTKEKGNGLTTEVMLEVVIKGLRTGTEEQKIGSLRLLSDHIQQTNFDEHLELNKSGFSLHCVYNLIGSTDSYRKALIEFLHAVYYPNYAKIELSFDPVDLAVGLIQAIHPQTEETLVLKALELLEVIMQESLKPEGTTALSYKIFLNENGKCLQKIEDLQKHPSELVYKKVDALIENYFVVAEETTVKV